MSIKKEELNGAAQTVVAGSAGDDVFAPNPKDLARAQEKLAKAGEVGKQAVAIVIEDQSK